MLHPQTKHREWFFPTSLMLSSYNSQRPPDYKLTVLLLEKPVSLIQTDWQQILVHNREVPRTTTWYWPWLECSLPSSSTHRAITSSCWDEQWRTPYPTMKKELLISWRKQYIIMPSFRVLLVWTFPHWLILLTSEMSGLGLYSSLLSEMKRISRGLPIWAVSCCALQKSSFYKGNGLRLTWWALSGEDY